MGRKTARARSEKQIKSKFMKSKFHQVTHVRRQSVESEHTALNGHIHQIRELPPSSIVEGVVFRIEEHLRVQQQTERRAHELWCVGGRRHDTALSDWLQAEQEVLEVFIGGYIREHSWPRSPRPGFSVGVPCRKAKARILKHRQAITARHPRLASKVGKTRRDFAT